MAATTAQFANDANTKGLWHMDGTVGSAGKKADSSSIANNLTEGNTPSSQTGQIATQANGAYGFNGTTGNQYLSASYNANYDGQTAFTIEGWVYFNTLPSANPLNNVEILRHWSGSAGWILETNSSNQIIWVINASGGGTVVLTGNAAVTTGAWYYIAVTYTGSSMNIYVNGSLDATTSQSGTMSSYNAPIYFGIQDNLTQRQLDGRLDEWRLSNVARSAASISAYYNVASPAFLAIM